MYEGATLAFHRMNCNGMQGSELMEFVTNYEAIFDVGREMMTKCMNETGLDFHPYPSPATSTLPRFKSLQPQPPMDRIDEMSSKSTASSSPSTSLSSISSGSSPSSASDNTANSPLQTSLSSRSMIEVPTTTTTSSTTSFTNGPPSRLESIFLVFFSFFLVLICSFFYVSLCYLVVDVNSDDMLPLPGFAPGSSSSSSFSSTSPVVDALLQLRSQLLGLGSEEEESPMMKRYIHSQTDSASSSVPLKHSHLDDAAMNVQLQLRAYSGLHTKNGFRFVLLVRALSFPIHIFASHFVCVTCHVFMIDCVCRWRRECSFSVAERSWSSRSCHRWKARRASEWQNSRPNDTHH